MTELTSRGIPFRNEQALQDLSAEPAACLVVDFLFVVTGEREPDAYGRLMGALSPPTGLDEGAAYQSRARWHRFIDETRDQARQDGAGSWSAGALRKLAEEFLRRFGAHALAALSADYEHGDRLQEIIVQTFDRITDILSLDEDAARALARFSEDSAVRIMIIHKCKGLEFDSVILLGVEEQTFWGKPTEERAAYFVGISRAKRRLYLTVAEHRPRPEGFNGMWKAVRSPHAEFLDYATSTS